MTTPPPTTGPGSNPNTTGANNAEAKTFTKTKLEANKEKKKRRKQREKYNNNNNNNYVKFDGLITEGITKEVTISPGSSARMTSDFRIFKRSECSSKRLQTLAGCY